MKERILYWIFFFLLLIVVSYMYMYLLNYILPSEFQSGVFGAITVILIYLLVLIPLTAYISEKVIVFSVSKGSILTTLVIALPVIMISLNIYNEYREKGLGEVIEYDTSDVEELVFYEGHPPHNWKTDEVEHADALKEFLSQYRVKKMSDDEWNTNVSKEKGFQVTIYLEDKIIMSTIYENRLMVLGSSSGSIFKVTNGPIDVEWVENYLKKHRN